MTHVTVSLHVPLLVVLNLFLYNTLVTYECDLDESIIQSGTAGCQAEEVVW